jgi:hypothetical protein
VLAITQISRHRKPRAIPVFPKSAIVSSAETISIRAKPYFHKSDEFSKNNSLWGRAFWNAGIMMHDVGGAWNDLIPLGTAEYFMATSGFGVFASQSVKVRLRMLDLVEC